VLDPQTSECLHYEPVMGYPPTRFTRIPRAILDAHLEIEIRNDLIDCSIDVCSAEVSCPMLSLFFLFFIYFARFPRCSKTTLITSIYEGILSMVFLLRIC
jgi:hypothetical protein